MKKSNDLIKKIYINNLFIYDTNVSLKTIKHNEKLQLFKFIYWGYLDVYK